MDRYVPRIWLLIVATVFGWAMQGHMAAAAPPLETVSGTACYTYGDDQTPALAKRAAYALAQEQAVRSHHVFVESSNTVKNFQLEEDIVTTASTGILLHTRIDKETQEGQKICISITAQISPIKLDELIQQKAKAKKVAAAAQIAVLTKGSSFELKMGGSLFAPLALSYAGECRQRGRSNGLDLDGRTRLSEHLSRIRGHVP